MAWPASEGSRQIEHPFTQGQSVRLHRTLAAERVGEGFGLLGILENAGLRRWNSVFLHEVLGKHFGGFELGSTAVRPPNAETLVLEKIDDPHRQGVIRAYDSEVDFLVAGEHQQTLEVLGPNLDALHLRTVTCEALACDTRIPGSAPQFCRVGRPGDFPHQRVFASTGTDHQNFHESELKHESGEAERDNRSGAGSLTLIG